MSTENPNPKGPRDELTSQAQGMVKALKGVDEHLTYLATELDVERQREAPPTFLVDWDVIQTFAEYRLARSIYAASATRAFKEASHLGIRVVVSQGTRMELTYYLAAKLSRPLSAAPPATDEEKRGSTDGLYGDPTFESNKVKLLRTRHAIEIARFLDTFSTDYAMPVSELPDGPFTAMNMRELRKTEAFRSAHDQIRAKQRTGSRRNVADAANIAILDLGEEAGCSYRLVTGTQMLYDLRPDSVVDPITFLLYLHVRGQASQLSTSQLRLNEMRQRVLELLTECALIHRGAQAGRSFITPKIATAWCKALRRMTTDSVIGETVGLIAAAQFDARNRFAVVGKAEEFAKLTIEPARHEFVDVRKALTVAGGSLARFYGSEDPLGDLGYTWTRTRKVASHLAKDLLAQDGTKILEFSASPDCFTASWPSGVDLDEFFQVVADFLAAGTLRTSKNSGIRLIYRDRPLRDLGLSKRSLAAARWWVSSPRVDLVRISAGSRHVVYDAGDSSLERQPHVAVIADLDDTDIARRFYDATFMEFVPESSFGTGLSDLCSTAAK